MSQTNDPQPIVDPSGDTAMNKNMETLSLDSSENTVVQSPPIEYPIKVTYCGVCTLPIEYCQYYPTYDKCKEWLENNLPDEFNKLNLNQDGNGKVQSKQSGKQGGKGIVKIKKKVGNRKVELFRSNRGKKKFVTVIRGLLTFEVDLKEASKLFASKFACGSSVTGEDEIVVQGDVKEDLIELLQKHWPDIEEELIEDLGDKKY